MLTNINVLLVFMGLGDTRCSGPNRRRGEADTGAASERLLSLVLLSKNNRTLTATNWSFRLLNQAFFPMLKKLGFTFELIERYIF